MTLAMIALSMWMARIFLFATMGANFSPTSISTPVSATRLQRAFAREIWCGFLVHGSQASTTICLCSATAESSIYWTRVNAWKPMMATVVKRPCMSVARASVERQSKNSNGWKQSADDATKQSTNDLNNLAPSNKCGATSS